MIMPGKAPKKPPTFSQCSVGQLFLYLILTIPLQVGVDWMTNVSVPLFSWLINPLGSLFNFVLGIFRFALIIFMIRNSIVNNRENARIYHQNRRTGRTRVQPVHRQEQPVSDVKPDIPIPTPEPKTTHKKPAEGAPRDSIHPWAMTMLNEMQSDLQDVEERRRKLDALMDDFFGNSKISRTRYDSVIDSSIKVLHTNYEKASQAARLFNPTEPLPESAKQIILDYKKDSDQIVGDLNKVIVALLKTHQDEVINQNDVFDTMLDELVQTTSLYGRTSHSSLFSEDDDSSRQKPAGQ